MSTKDHMDPEEDTGMAQAVINGVSAAPGIAVGPAFIYNPEHSVLSSREIGKSEIREEQDKAASALRILDLELRKLIQLSDGNNDAREILEFHRAVLKDPELIAGINQHIRVDLYAADRAVYETLNHYIQNLKRSGNPYFQERISDLRDVRDRLIRVIQQKELIVGVDSESVVICRDITPSEILLFARSKVRGLVSEQGGVTSHAAIIAKSMGIPFVINARGAVDAVETGRTIIVNGSRGVLITNPSEPELDEAESAIRQSAENQKKRTQISRKPGQTRCGRRIEILANVELESELDKVSEMHSDGIGLLRTEMYFMTQDEQKDESDTDSGFSQRAFLQKAARLMDGKELTVRLYDVGGDKIPDGSKSEQNPFLGWRGIRMLLERPSLLKSQFRLIFEALEGQPGTLQILVPMITTLREVRQTKAIMNEVLENYPGLKGKVKFGIMIEVPAAAVMAEKLVEEVDFFSIGTNDLAQYTLAADRTNSKVQHIFNQWHPSVWRLIKTTLSAAAEKDIPVTVCGELASDPAAAVVLAGMGITKLSMNPTAMPEVKSQLIKLDYSLMQEFCERVLHAADIDEVEEIRSQIAEIS